MHHVQDNTLDEDAIDLGKKNFAEDVYVATINMKKLWKDNIV